MEIICKEMIRPSTPTPQHQQMHKLSSLDQLAPSHFFPLIYFYSAGCICKLQTSLTLKESLSTTLDRFYPLAGRINGSCSVDCNDAGALFVEVKVHAILSQQTIKGRIQDLDRYLPFDPHANNNNDILLAIQANYFDCNGLAIGVCISHKIADGFSMVMFMNSWAAICRGDADIVQQPDFELGSKHFPPKNLPKQISSKCPNSGNGAALDLVTKRFVFDKEKLGKLKKEITSTSSLNPSRVGVVTSFMWKHFIDVAKVIRRETETFAALHAFNLRSRVKPSLSEHAFGNIWRFQISLSNSSECDQQYHNLVSEIRNAAATTKINEVGNSGKLLMDLFEKGETEICTFSSWCRFPVYEVDFGWGRPEFVSTTAIPFKNAVILMSTSDGEGIEALVTMLEEDLAVLEKNEDFMSHMAHEFV